MQKQPSCEVAACFPRLTKPLVGAGWWGRRSSRALLRESHAVTNSDHAELHHHAQSGFALLSVCTYVQTGAAPRGGRGGSGGSGSRQLEGGGREARRGQPPGAPRGRGERVRGTSTLGGSGLGTRVLRALRAAAMAVCRNRPCFCSELASLRSLGARRLRPKRERSKLGLVSDGPLPGAHPP